MTVDNLLPGEVPFRTVPVMPLGLVFCNCDIHSRLGVVQNSEIPNTLRLGLLSKFAFF